MFPDIRIEDTDSSYQSGIERGPILSIDYKLLIGTPWNTRRQKPDLRTMELRLEAMAWKGMQRPNGQHGINPARSVSRYQ